MSLTGMNIPIKHPEYVLLGILITLIILLIAYLIYIRKNNRKKKIKEINDRDERFSKVTIEERSKAIKRFSNKK